MLPKTIKPLSKSLVIDAENSTGRSSFLAAKYPPTGNHLLAALPAADYGRLRPHLEAIYLPLGWSLYESGRPMTHVFFPVEGVVSMLSVMGNGESSEIATIGNEGLIGISLFLGTESTPSRAIVQSSGLAYRLRASDVMKEFNRGGEFQRLLLRFTQGLMAQIIQTAACNHHHNIDQQFCRWLLLTLDCVPSNEIIMTQEMLAHMQGIRRQGITNAATDLQASGIIHYKRGKITVLNRRKLEQRACECYGVIKRESDRLVLMGKAKVRQASERVASDRRGKDRRDVKPVASRR